MSPYKMFKTDSKMETEGVWLDYGDFKIRIARAGGANANFAAAMERAARPHQAQIKNRILPNDVARRIMAEAYASSVLLDWEGVADENGKALEFTFDNAVKLLTDLPALFEDIQEQSNQLVLFRRETLEQAAKNS